MFVRLFFTIPRQNQFSHGTELELTSWASALAAFTCFAGAPFSTFLQLQLFFKISSWTRLNRVLIISQYFSSISYKVTKYVIFVLKKGRITLEKLLLPVSFHSHFVSKYYVMYVIVSHNFQLIRHIANYVKQKCLCMYFDATHWQIHEVSYGLSTKGTRKNIGKYFLVISKKRDKSSDFFAFKFILNLKWCIFLPYFSIRSVSKKLF